MDRIAFAPLIIVIALVATFFLFSSISSMPGTGLFTIYFADCGDGDCTGNEDYLNCPQDCCESDCTATADSVCHVECSGYPVASPCSFSSGCDGLDANQTICADSSNYLICCSGAPTTCSIGTECTAGSCTACSVECSIDANCDDSNALTTDVCLNPGACDSDCNYTACPVECNNNAGCDDSTHNVKLFILSEPASPPTLQQIR